MLEQTREETNLAQIGNGRSTTMKKDLSFRDSTMAPSGKTITAPHLSEELNVMCLERKKVDSKNLTQSK